MRVLPFGPGALLAEYDSLAEVMSVDEALRVSQLAGIDEIIPAARTVLVTFHHVDRAALQTLLVPGAAATRIEGPIVEIPVVYDGEDLGEVADATGLTTQQIVDTHSSTVYSAAFLGFTPGWAYLVGLPPSIQLPRRSTPRTAVPAGSVAIANEFTGVYPTVSPGGWHLLGHTSVQMFDVARDKPALVVAGDRVRFVPT
jgi:KipI family sensor histidine kinase inhibitor